MVEHLHGSPAPVAARLINSGARLIATFGRLDSIKPRHRAPFCVEIAAIFAKLPPPTYAPLRPPNVLARLAT